VDHQDETASPGGGVTTLGGGTVSSGSGMPDTGGGTPFHPIPAEFNHCVVLLDFGRFSLCLTSTSINDKS